ncbi:MAG: hypothetical protein LC650_03840 [Actinobacteria bacterium]|nr:hypothetical protein [Actinomycetota bacterium]
MENELNTIHEKRDTLFRAAVAGRPVAAVVRLMGTEYTVCSDPLRLRVGHITTLDTERGYVTLRLRDGRFRNARIRDVLALTPL